MEIKKDHEWLCLFYLIHVAWIYFMNEILLKKNLFHNFWIYKNRSDFFMYAIFLSQKQIWSFIKPKSFFLSFQKLIWCFFFQIKRFCFVKKDLIFLSLTNQLFFFKFSKIDMIFYKPNSIFFLLTTIDLNFFIKQRRGCIHK